MNTCMYICLKCFAKMFSLRTTQKRFRVVCEKYDDLKQNLGVYFYIVFVSIPICLHDLGSVYN